MARKPRKSDSVVVAKREPNERESEAMASAKVAYGVRPMRAEIEARGDDNANAFAIGPRHTDAKGHSYQLCDALGTTSNDFTSAGLLALANLNIKDGAPSVEAVNASLALVGAIAPQNELEAALALQMVATHDLSMDLLRRAKHSANRDAMRDFANLATKLNRTFAVQMKTLGDWRRGGEQVVRHVHVYEGGQAVVAETINVGGTNANGLNQPHVQSALGAPMWCPDPIGQSLPGTGDEREEALSPSRRG